MKIRQLVVRSVARYANGVETATSHLLALDDSGRIWERFSDDEPGKWAIVPGPVEVPDVKVRKHRKVA